MRYLIVAGVLLLSVATAHAQWVVPHDPQFGWGETDPLIADFVNSHTRVDGPSISARGLGPVATASFTVTIENEIPEATAAIEAATELWSTHVASSVPIEVLVRWIELEGNVLGASAPRLIANFSAALQPNTWFPTALANALQGQNLNPDHPDIELQLNANFKHWYFGTDGAPPEDTFDLMTVVIHEIGHGLGFVGSMRVSNNQGSWGQGTQRWPMVYDIFAEADYQGITSSLLDTSRFPNPSLVLGSALQSQEVYFDSPMSVSANVESQQAQGLPVPPGGRPKLYAPDPWVPGSSYSHLTEEQANDAQVYYPPGSLNSLMTPRLAATEVIRTPGPVTCGMFRDLGWPLGPACEAMIPPDEITFEEPILVAGPCPHPAVGGRTRLGLHVPEAQRVRVSIYDVLGRRVRTALDRGVFASNPTFHGNGRLACGEGVGFFEIDTSGLASGMYVLAIRGRDATQSVRIVVVN